MKQRGRWSGFALALGAALAGGAWILYRFNPATAAIYPPCPFHALTGMYCPGCGSLRATHEFLHGRIGAAFRLNPLLVLALPLLALIGAAELRKPGRISRLPAWVIWGILGVILAFWVLRNVPCYPFTGLAPH